MKYFLLLFFVYLFNTNASDYIVATEKILNLPDENKIAKKREKKEKKETNKKLKEALVQAIDINTIPDDLQYYGALLKINEDDGKALPYLKNKNEKNSVKFKKIIV